MWKFLTKKWLTSHIEREHQTNESKPKIYKLNKKNILPEKQRQGNNLNVSTYENHAYVVRGPRSVGETYYMLEILEK